MDCRKEEHELGNTVGVPHNVAGHGGLDLNGYF